MLNDAQMDVVESDEDILCCACPGSGKTTVIAEKVKHVLRTQSDARIILVTFSRDAANEMSVRIRNSRISPPVDAALMRRVTFGTYHSLALRQLKSLGKCKKILSSLELNHAIQRSLWDLRKELKVSEDSAAEYIACCKSNAQYALENPELAKLADTYQEHVDAMGGMDFTDILLQANRLMRSGEIPPLPATHIMADEYQDTDAVQADWLELHLLDGCLACAVGDDDQSIFAFRRSLGYRGMMRFVEACNARIIRLDTNYRSTSGIIECAGHLIASNFDRIKKDFKVARGAGPYPEVITIVPALCDQTGEVVTRVKALCSNVQNIREGQVAILSRTNLQLDEIEETFRRLDIPYTRTGRQFWDIKVLQVYLALLQAAIERSGAGIYIGLRWAGLSEASILKISEHGDLWALVSRKDFDFRKVAHSHAAALLHCYHDLAPVLDQSSHKAADLAIEKLAGWMSDVLNNVDPFVDTQQKQAPKSKGMTMSAESGLKVLKMGRDSLKQYEGTLKTRLGKVQNNSSRKDKCGVALSTFHASKGLEWQHVMMIDVDDGSVPSSDADGSLAALEEERRIAYVAMTRARDTLTLFRHRDKPLSEFLTDARLVEPSLSATGTYTN